MAEMLGQRRRARLALVTRGMQGGGLKLAAAGALLIVRQRRLHAAGARPRDIDLRQGIQPQQSLRRVFQHGFGQLTGGIFIVADHAGEVARIQRAVDTDDREAIQRQFAVEGVIGGQAAGGDQRIDPPRLEHARQLALGFRLIVGADDEQLIVALTCPALQQLGQAGITGVLQIRQHEAKRAAFTTPQRGCLGIDPIVMTLYHRHDALDRLGADTSCLCLPIDHITGGGA